jgi:hypothetical protein
MSSASAAQPNTLASPEPVVVNRSHHEFDKTLFDSLLSRRFFFAPAFEIYGGRPHCMKANFATKLTSRYDGLSRCGRALRLWSPWIILAGQHLGRMEKALYHRRGHVRIRHYHYDLARCFEDFRSRR